MSKIIHYIRTHKKTFIGLFCVLIGSIVYLVFFRTITLSPVAEANRMEQLEQTKTTHQLSLFVSDGCSGNVSNNWRVVVEQMSEVSESFAESFRDAQTIPFEYACVAHDRAYHAGEGGYVGRLQADLSLRSEIISYAIENVSTIQSRAGLNTPEETLFLYELLAEAMYRAVRLGGAPCTSKPYAWGYGYAAGSCDSQGNPTPVE
jgi:hypothetical protein